MKQLKEYILEGIFDVDKNVTDVHEIEKSMFEDYNSEFWDYVIPTWNFGKLPEDAWNREEKSIDINKNEIWIPDMNIELNTELKNPFTNKYSLHCNSFRIGNLNSSGPHPDPMTDGGGFKEIIVNCDITIDGYCKKLNGFNFKFTSNNSRTNKVSIRWGENLDLSGTSIMFDNQNIYNTIYFSSILDFPDLKKLKSNANALSFYDPSLFDWDNIKSKLNKFFGSGTITANGITKKKNIRNIVAVVNNMKKYGSLDPDQVIPEGKLSDLIDLSNLKDVNRVVMKSNNVRITFVKNDKDIINIHARFIRINNMNKYKSASIEDMVALVERCKTKDGWVVMLEPEIF